MGNALTGDFDAVLQVNQTVFRRLVAGLHSNDGDDTTIPTLPHLLALDVDQEGMQGRLVAQIGVPLVSLIDGATDRIRLEIQVRGLFTVAPDSAGAFLPPHIRGKVTCVYRFAPATGKGWRPGDLQAQVDPDSVRFDGRASGSVHKPDVSDGDHQRRIRELLVQLLRDGMRATPFRFGTTFRPDRVVTLNRGDGAAVAVPVAGNGQPRSIQKVFVGARDVAVAISQEAILARARAALAEIQATFGAILRFRVTAIWELWDVVDIGWRISITEARVTWLGGAGGSGQVEVRISVTGDTTNPALDWAVHLRQVVRVSMDAAGRVTAAPFGEPEITVDYHGLYADRVRREAEDHVRRELRARIATMTQELTADLQIAARADELARQLRGLDRNVTVAFEHTRFTPDGVVVVGNVGLSGPKPWTLRHAVDTSGRSGYSALATWVPGGWVDTYDWSWSADGHGTMPSRAFTDQWVVRPLEDVLEVGQEPPSQVFTLGLGPAMEPMPGIGSATGSVTLVVEGWYIDDVTGAKSDFRATTDVVDFAVPSYLTDDVVGTGITRHGGIAAGPGLTRIIATSLLDPLGIGYRYGTAARLRSNSLVVKLGPDADATALATTLGAGLRRVTREGSGLQVIVLVELGRDGGWQVEAAAALRSELRGLVPSVVYEDVDGDWARGLGMPDDGDASWTAIVSPQGGVPWADRGTVGGAALTDALDTYLVPSGPPVTVPVTQAITEGTILSPWALARAAADGLPPPVGRTGRRTVLTFVRPDAAGTNDEVVGRLRSELAPSVEDTSVVVVVHGADERAVSRADLDDGDPVVADPDGEIARRLGVSIWPTTLLIDEDGRVVRVLTTSWSPTRSAPTVVAEEVGS